MSSLREVKDRIDSVRSTLKITSAMKLVASSKLRKAQRTIESMRPYQQELESILARIQRPAEDVRDSGMPEGGEPWPALPDYEGGPVRPAILLAFSSNSSMCGAFNANVIKKAVECMNELSGKGAEVQVWSFGRKMTEALRKRGTPAARDYSSLVAAPDYSAIAAIAAELRGMHAEGEISGATLVYNHFVSTGRQQAVAESFLDAVEQEPADFDESVPVGQGYILEPSRDLLLESLLPQVNNLALYTALLDSAAAEHAARMVAMQAATDNGEQLLSELTLEYNKGRQQKITSEILDLAGGAAQ